MTRSIRRGYPWPPCERKHNWRGALTFQRLARNFWMIAGPERFPHCYR